MEGTGIFRVVAGAVFLLDFAIGAWYRRRARRAEGRPGRGDEPLTLRAGRVLVAGPLFLGFLVWLIRPSWLAWAVVEAPTSVRWVGVGLLLATVPLSWWVMRHLGSGVTETVLVAERSKLSTTGPYRRVRHPLYTTSLVLWSGVSLAAASLFFGLFTLLLAALYLFVVIPSEEEALLREFGPTYEAYREQTGRLLPPLRVRTPSSSPGSARTRVETRPPEAT